MCGVYNILEELRVSRSRLYKIDVLERNKDYPLFKEVIKATLDPYVQYYIRKIPDYIPYYKGGQLEWGLEQLKFLSSREFTGHAGIKHLTEILEGSGKEDAKVIEYIIGKDLECGVSIKTVNKVFGKDFIAEYPCMLASPYKQKNLDVIKYPAIVQTKLDGMRANIICDKNGEVEIRTRNGKLIDLHGVFDEFVKCLFVKSATLADLDQFHGAVLDGELMVLSEEDGQTVLDRKTGNGILNKGVKGTITPAEAARTRFMAWDMIPLEDFYKGKSNRLYFDRVDILNTRIDEIYKTWTFPRELIKIVPSLPVTSLEEVMRHFQEALEEGEEGIILKNGDSIWEAKRSKDQVKLKAELELDLIVTEWVEGKGRLKGKMGSVVAESADRKICVSVGSGFNDEDREMVAVDIVGKIISVKYNEMIKDKRKDTYSLFLPIYQEIRNDKEEADVAPR